jgi:hypothetical protein
MDRVDYQSLIIQDLINLNNKGELDTNPWFQRRSVWLRPAKSYLINTLFERKPIPAIYIRHKIDLEKGISVKEVVDGQQRSKAIISFCKDEFTSRHPNGKLVKFSDLSSAQKEHFLITPLPIGYLLGATDADVIDIFARINSVSKNLNGQEKRNAKFSGEFKQFSINEAVKRTNFWREYSIFSDNDIARMNEVLFMSDVAINLMDGLSTYTVGRIDSYYKNFDDDFPKMQEITDRLKRIFDVVISLSPTTIKKTIFTERPPLFFSLVTALDSVPSYNIKKIESGIIEINDRFNSDVPLADKEADDVEFIKACSASTSTKDNRTIRHNYIKKWIK